MWIDNIPRWKFGGFSQNELYQVNDRTEWIVVIFRVGIGIWNSVGRGSAFESTNVFDMVLRIFRGGGHVLDGVGR